MALKPITRQEQIVAGKDLEPITRMERFLKEYGGVSSWNDLTDKPFGTETTPDIVFTAEDIANPIERIELPESGGVSLVKVSDKVLATDELNGMSVAWSYGGTEVVTDNNPLISEMEGAKSIMSEVLQIPVGYVVERDTALDFVLSPGLWLYDYPEESGIKTISVTIPGKETIKPIDEKYLPPLVSPSGKKFKLSVDDSGVLSATEV